MVRRRHRVLVLCGGLALVVGAVGCTKGDEAAPSTSSVGGGGGAGGTSAPGSSTSSSVRGPATAGADVTVEKNTFTPASVKIKAGEGVKFVNKDPEVHRITSGVPGAPTNDFLIDVQGGTTGTTKALTAGTYAFFAADHPEMTGTIVVE